MIALRNISMMLNRPSNIFFGKYGPSYVAYAYDKTFYSFQVKE